MKEKIQATDKMRTRVEMACYKKQFGLDNNDMAVAVVDGRPEVVVSMDGIAKMVRHVNTPEAYSLLQRLQAEVSPH